MTTAAQQRNQPGRQANQQTARRGTPQQQSKRSALDAAIAETRRKTAEVGQQLGERIKLIESLLPSDRKAEASRFVALVQLAVSRSDKLQKCSTDSIIDATLTAAQTGLSPDGRLAALVPFYSQKFGYQAQFIPMVAGLMASARKAGVSAAEAHVVRQGDVFSARRENGRSILKHRADPSQRGEIIGAYALVHYVGGAWSYEFMNVDEINGIRDRSPSVRSGASSPWATDYSEMARKTVLRRALKRYFSWPSGTPAPSAMMQGADLDDEPDSELDIDDYGGSSFTAASGPELADDEYLDDDGEIHGTEPLGAAERAGHDASEPPGRDGDDDQAAKLRAFRERIEACETIDGTREILKQYLVDTDGEAYRSSAREIANQHRYKICATNPFERVKFSIVTSMSVKNIEQAMQEASGLEFTAAQDEELAQLIEAKESEINQAHEANQDEPGSD